MSQAVAQKAKTEVAVSDLSSLLEEEAGAGLENFTTDDMQIPFIRILQALSPQLNKQDSLYIREPNKATYSTLYRNRYTKQMKV